MENKDYLETFLGTGENNAEGKSLKEFLEEYNPKEYDAPSHTVDCLVFQRENLSGNLKILMIKRKNHPNIGFWALPGGFVDMEEDLESAASRELEEETGLKGVQMEQLASYGAVHRDPRTRVITTAFIGMICSGMPGLRAGDDAQDALWFEVEFNLLSEREIEEAGAPSVEKTYRLIVENKSFDLRLEARIQSISIRDGMIKNTKYTVKHAVGLASDHPAIIAEGIQYLRSLKE
ncbi:NUDIX domain-containing protein [Parasporobacterium paucivorans]|uniref:8-oxo-dGTP diphosphatase n=1 Tax=Parasporobacterium paucivorans DSM 15970 TaxID=1122934 RepID=A0A1M6BDC6_9FIRM|nr:NUDIX hydrolase [Parasporobacterium paucivorans]SHI46750.1 8-oxo-dGTP diphosphatase [Parasporobacterium paucivorans DSM 15970]